MGKDDEKHNDGANVDPEVDPTTTGETVDTTEAGTSSEAEAPHHEANAPGQNKQ